eukprot:4158880-Pyramimonas_sp.AAC.1
MNPVQPKCQPSAACKISSPLRLKRPPFIVATFDGVGATAADELALTMSHVTLAPTPWKT